MRLGAAGGAGPLQVVPRWPSTPPLNAASSFVMSSSSEGARLLAVSRRVGAPWLLHQYMFVCLFGVQLADSFEAAKSPIN